eukprot:gene18133-19943_t
MSDRQRTIDSWKERVKKLREKAGKDFSDEDITKKINDVFNGFNWEESSKDGFSIAWFLVKFVKWTTLLIFGFFLICLGVYMAYLFNPHVSRRLGDAAHDRNMAYYIARTLRIISLPLHSVFDLKRLQKWHCLVKNPFFQAGLPNCEPCEIPLEVEAFNATDKQALEVSLSGEPTIIKNERAMINASYNYSFMREFYLKNKESLDFSICDSYGDVPNKRLHSYFSQTNEEVMENQKTFGWNNCRIEGTRALRKLFPRPSFIPIMSEIFLEKSLFFIHPKSKNVLEMPECGTENCFIAQVYGSSEIRLSPFDECKQNCTTTSSAELNTGEIFYHPGTPWKVLVDAVGDDLSIIYRSDFT